LKRQYTTHFQRAFRAAPPRIQSAFEKQSGLLLSDPRHPSLRAKKFEESTGVWQARVTGSWRMYFKIVGDTYEFLDIISHPK